MIIRLKRRWMGLHVGVITKVSYRDGIALLRRDIAEEMEPESIEEIRKKLQNIMAENLSKSN